MKPFFVYKLKSRDFFKQKDWFYLDGNTIPRKLTTQEMINIKLGVKYKKCQHDTLIRQIDNIIDDKLYYYENKTIEIK